VVLETDNVVGRDKVAGDEECVVFREVIREEVIVEKG
jgi:hypothetical protein